MKTMRKLSQLFRDFTSTKSKHKLGARKGTAMAEAAITLPVMVLLTLAMINVSMAWFVAVAAGNAANYGARIGSVAQSNCIAYSIAAAETRLDAVNVGSYSVSASGGGFRGAQVVVSVDWVVPNYLGSLISYAGGGTPSNFSGTAISTFRQEGW